MEHTILVEKENCIGCSLCVKVCPAWNIRLTENKAEILSQSCIKCGHCVAVCPKEAVSMTGFEEEPMELRQGRGISADDFLYALKVRRSIRIFKDKKVEKEVVEKLIEAGRFTPTAKNRQDVEYIILDREKEKLEAHAVNLFRKVLKVVSFFKKSYREFEIDKDFFFKKAPLVILVVAKDKTDGILAASSMAFMAEASGLGVLYSGFFTVACMLSRPIKKALKLKKKKVQTVLVIGYPDIQYKRGVQREKARVSLK